MARTPKLEIYKFRLKPYKATEFKTFQDYINENGIDTSKAKKDSFTKLFQFAISDIEKGKAFEDNSTEKKLRIFNKSKSKSLNRGFSAHSEKYFFEGIIGGGTYGIERIKIKSENNDDDDELIEVGDTIYEPFYILVYAPLDSNKGLLFVQTYTDEGISKTVRTYIKKLFSGSKYYNAEVTAWYPDYLIDECNDGKEIQKLIFTKTILQKRIATNPIKEEEEFTVKVTITPNKKNNKDQKNVKGLIAIFSDYALKTTVGQFFLKDFKPQISATTNEFKTPRIFEIDGKNDLMPIILLENHGITINAKGTPDFDQLKKFSIDLFEKIEPEFRNLNN